MVNINQQFEQLYVNEQLVKNRAFIENAMSALNDIIDECNEICTFMESIENKVVKERSRIISLRRMHFENEKELEIYENDRFTVRNTIEDKFLKVQNIITFRFHKS